MQLQKQVLRKSSARSKLNFMQRLVIYLEPRNKNKTFLLNYWGGTTNNCRPLNNLKNNKSNRKKRWKLTNLPIIHQNQVKIELC